MQTLQQNQEIAPSYNVLKAGGTTVSSPHLEKCVAKLYEDSPEKSQMFVVVSAFKRKIAAENREEGMTSKIKDALGELTKCDDWRENFELNFNNFFSDPNGETVFAYAVRQIDDFLDPNLEENQETRRKCLDWANLIIATYKKHLRRVIAGLPENFDKKLASGALKKHIVGLGEDLSAGIVALCFKKSQGIKTGKIAFIVDENGNYRFDENCEQWANEIYRQVCAKEINEENGGIEIVREFVRNSINETLGKTNDSDQIYFVGGFAGLDSDSYSDPTAAVIAENLAIRTQIENVSTGVASECEKAVKLYLLKDEPFIRSCDPRKLANRESAIAYEDISWREIQDFVELTGGKPLAADFVSVLSETGDSIELIQIDPRNPDLPGTRFSNKEKESNQPFKMLHYREKGTISITINDFKLAKSNGFISQLTQDLKEKGISVYGLNTPGNQVSLTINLPPNNKTEADKQAVLVKDIFEKWKNSGVKINGSKPRIPKEISMHYFDQLAMVGVELQENSIQVLATISEILKENGYRVRNPLIGDRPSCVVLHLEHKSPENKKNPMQLIHDWMRSKSA
jgi:aspartokinase